MKKITILFVSVLSLGLTLTSCSKDDDSSSSSVTIEGKWNYSKEGAIVGGTEMLVDYSGNESGCSKDFMMFNSNGVLVETDYDSFDTPCEVFTYNGTWSKSGNNVSITFDGLTDTFEILTLDGSTLKVKSSEGEIYVMTRS